MTTLPTEREINPISGDLDGETAVRHFLGKSVQDIVAELDEYSLSYQEDLMWMGPRAFCYYLPAFLQHLRERCDSELVPFIASVLEFRLDHDRGEIQTSFPTMRAICEHLLALADDDVEVKYKERLRVILLRIES